jgi:hypothetical protein
MARGSCAFREHHGQHFEDDSLHVVFRLRLGQAQGVHLHAIAESAQLGICHLVAGQGQLVPHLAEGPQLATLFDETYAGIDKERDPLDDLRERIRSDFARSLDPIENRHRGAQGVGQLLHRRRPRLLQVVAADVGRIPFRHMLDRVVDRIGDQAHRRTRRIDVGAAREIFLDDVVLGGAAQFGRIDPSPLRQADVQRQEPRRRGIDGHRGVHLIERDLVEQLIHVLDDEIGTPTLPTSPRARGLSAS